MLERNSDPSNPRRPCGSAWHEVIICEKDRINRVVAAIAIQPKRLAIASMMEFSVKTCEVKAGPFGSLYREYRGVENRHQPKARKCICLLWFIHRMSA